MITTNAMMQAIFKIGLAILIAAMIAYWSVDWALRRPSEKLRNGPWETDLNVGSAAADIYQRARVAKHGIWALASSEVVYYSANTASDGEPLRCDATYRIQGKDVDTRWWSITAYVNDHFIPNPDDCYSFSSTSVQRESDGSWSILASPTKQVKNWLPLGESAAGTLGFALRCYNPNQGIRDNPRGVVLPSIVQEKTP